ncbi:MAG: hypothetical protein ACRDIB_03970, partial [Ardenticatenaceae bacterium]
WSLYPWILFFFYRLASRPTRAYFLAALVSYSLLLMTHNISAMLFTPFLGLYVLWQAIAHRNTPFAFYPLVAFVGAIGVAAVFLVPALGEARYTQVDVLTKGYFDVATHFISWKELLASTPRLDYRAINPPIPFNLGRMHVLLALLGGLAIVLPTPDRERRLHLLFALLFALLLAWMMTPASLIVWRTVPGIAFAEFPTRLFGVLFLFTSFLAGASLLWLRTWPRLQWGVATLGGLALILAVAPYQFPRPFLSLDLTPAGFVRFEPAFNALGTTSAGEFLTIWSSRSPADSVITPTLARVALIAPPPTVEAEVIAETAHSLRLRASTPSTTTVDVAQFYFPGWRAWVDGK